LVHRHNASKTEKPGFLRQNWAIAFNPGKKPGFFGGARCRRRLKPRLHKQSLPPQTEENNVILTARSSYLFVRLFFHNKPIPAATIVPIAVIGSGTAASASAKGSYS